MSPLRASSLLALALAGCSHQGPKVGDADARKSESAPPDRGAEAARQVERSPEEHEDVQASLSLTSGSCPRSPTLDDPALRVDLPLDRHAFARCDMKIYSPTEIVSQAQYEELVECADPPGRPSFDFAEVRLMSARAPGPSKLLGATREPDGRILVHILRPGICSGVDWGEDLHTTVLPADGSPVEVVVCAEPSTCGPGEQPP